jgi:hypothetical protein
MRRRISMGVLIAVGTMAMSWAHAEAATCLQYRNIGGSSVCSKWSTKGVLLELTYKQPCGPEGEGEGEDGANCSAAAEAVTTNSIAFCSPLTNPGGLPVTKVQCTEQVTFFADEVGCEPKHGQDGTGGGGKGHDKGKHECKATIVLTQSNGCNATCSAAGFGPALDVTPITMDTNVAVTVVPSGEGGGGGVTSSCTFTPDYYGDTPACTFTEHCSINPNKIEFNAIRPYQCSLTSSGGPPPEPPFSD